MAITRNNIKSSDDSQHPFNDLESTRVVNNNSSSRTAANQSRAKVNDFDEIQDEIQGYYGVVTDFYNPSGTNAVVTMEADTYTDVEPQVYLEFDERPNSMKLASPEGMLPESHSDHGHETHGANHFSLAGLPAGAFVTVRFLGIITPEVDESQATARLHFLTNSATQATGLTEFSVETQAITMTQGAQQSYQDEILITFFVGDTLAGETLEDAGSFHVQVKSSVEADLEVLGVTMYINK